jgi:tRNA nucleotidyltransferase (CCA-adding enzyme)
LKKIDLITTHVNADFDGLGAMIGAKKLYPDARLIFPGSQEKMIKDNFVQEAFQHLNIEKARNIDFDQVRRVILVDTRSAKRLGVMEDFVTNGKPEIHIYDHHPLQPGDLEGDKVVYKDVGSTTTIIALMLKEKGIELNKEEATIMMAGIYEDTGSLTYQSTREEDFLACAWLLSQGSVQNIVRELISRDISKHQIKLLSEMLSELRVYSIYGYDIGITVATSEEYINDFAVLVQKVKDLENLPAMFGIGRFGDRIFIAARSRVPEVNVGEILNVFSGGGHPYAASATLKDFTVFQVEEMLIRELREKIEKPKVARDIMSLPVKYVFPDTTVDEAKDVLTRYNINMVPVCEKKDGKIKIIGLISRQNVEKAAFHGFHELPVRNFMTTEFFSIKPDSSIKEIQELVFRGRQRLLPVISDSEEPVGVVTRTDFLRILQDERVREEKTGEHREEFSKNLKTLMADLIDETIFKRLLKIGEVAASLGYNAYLVGGIVRDLLLRKTNFDVDIVVEGDGIKLVQTMAKMLEVKVTEHRKFGTAQLIFKDGNKIDIATARIEYYESPASLPTVEKGSLKLDLYRRDFTINTLAVKLDPDNFGEMIDFFGGVRDLKDGYIRVLHNLSFVEDPTRIFRAVRFESRFNFKLSKHTLYLIKNAVKMNLFELLSGTRLFSELELILREDEPEKILDRIAEIGMMEYIYPGLNWKTAKPHLVKAEEITSWYELLYTGIEIEKDIIYFLCLFNQLDYAGIKKLTSRFGVLGTFLKKVLESKSRQKETFEKIKKTRDMADFYFILKDLSAEAALYYMTTLDDGNVKKAFSLYFKEQLRIETFVKGDDLIAMGYKPSAVFSKIQETVLRERIKGDLKNREDEINFIHEKFPLN